MIEFESVTKRYRDGTTAVDDLNLTIPSGKITVLVGPSGCGKTTTLRMINRMIEPTRGKITWDGAPMRSKRRTALRRQMGYVIQSGGLFPHRTVLENVQTVPGLLRWDKKKARDRAMELLDLVGLDRKLGRRYPSQLSGGQQQRVGVARALAADPVVMLMDEPFSAVDPVVRADLQDELLRLQQQLGKTIVFITHDIDEAIKLGDQITILRQGGKLAQTGSPQQLLEEPADDFVAGFVGKDRGYRGLSFVPASGLPLESVQLVRDPASAQGDGPVLVIDENAGPLGWADRDRPGKTRMLGTTFEPDTDTMRIALDSALNSPVGLAVAVTSGGRFAGVVTASQILAQVRLLKASVADSISARAEADAARAEAEAAQAEAQNVFADAARVAAEADAEELEAARAEAAAREAEAAEAGTDDHGPGADVDQGQDDQGQVDQGQVDQGQVDQGQVDQGQDDQRRDDRARDEQLTDDQGTVSQGPAEHEPVEQDQTGVPADQGTVARPAVDHEADRPTTVRPAVRPDPSAGQPESPVEQSAPGEQAQNGTPDDGDSTEIRDR